MNKLLGIAVTIVAATVLSAPTACQPHNGKPTTGKSPVIGAGDISKQQKSDWFGNPTATPLSVADKCVKSEARAAPYDPASDRRPSGIDAQSFWRTVSYEVRAYQTADSKLGKYFDDVCVPVAIHLYATFDPRADARINGALVGKGALPRDSIETTPWQNHFFTFAYDPANLDDGQPPPRYSIDLKATYLRERDTLNTKLPAALTCAMFINGATVARASNVNLDASRGGFVSCHFDGISFEPPGRP
jgi:hypothetical protein